MNNSSYSKRLTEIDKYEVTKQLASQWKAILLVAFLMALFISGIRYFGDVSDYNDMLESKQRNEKIPTEERIEAALSSLNPNDREAVEYALQQREWLAEERAYVNNSILMNVDPTSQRTLILDYYISTNNKAGNESNSISASLALGYANYINNEKIIEGIRKLIDPAIDKKYIAELITTSSNEKEWSDAIASYDDGDVVLEIRIVLPESADSAEIEKVITEEISNYSSELSQSIEPHTIKLIRASEANLFNSVALKTRNDIIENINGLQNSFIKNTEATFNEQQLAAVEAISAIKDSAQNKDASAETDGSASPEKTNYPSINIKYALIGFVLGIIIYMCIYMGTIMAKGRIMSADIMKSITGSRIFGIIYKPDHYKGIRKLLKSDLINKIAYRGIDDVNNQVNKLASIIGTACKHDQISDLAILTLTNNCTEERCISEELLEYIRNNNIKAELIDVETEADEKELLTVKNAIIVAGRDSKQSQLRHLAELCNSYNIKQMGNVYIETI